MRPRPRPRPRARASTTQQMARGKKPAAQRLLRFSSSSAGGGCCSRSSRSGKEGACAEVAIGVLGKEAIHNEWPEGCVPVAGGGRSGEGSGESCEKGSGLVSGKAQRARTQENAQGRHRERWEGRGPPGGGLRSDRYAAVPVDSDNDSTEGTKPSTLKKPNPGLKVQVACLE